MARMEMQAADEIVAMMRQIGEEACGDVARRMVEAGAEEVKKAWKATAEKYGFVDSGEMIASIGSSAKDTGASGAIYRDIYPQGKDSKTGVRNAEKAFLLHYGTSAIKASYWVDEADEAAEAPMTEAMVRVWDEFLKTRT